MNASKPNAQPLELVVAANFTAEPVDAALHYWMHELQLPATIHHAPFDQVFQQLLDPGSLLRNIGDGIGLLLLRLQDWLDSESGPDRVAEELIDAVREAISGSSAQLVLCFAPFTGAHDAFAARVSGAESVVAEALRDEPGVRVLTSDTLLERYPCTEIIDPHGDRMASMPYTREAYCALGTALARSLYGLTVPGHKVLVLDCDDTLWGGLCSELGPRDVTITREHLALQRFAAEQRREGKLICLASRNNEVDVFAVFDQHPDMELSRDDLTAWEIHWGLKSESLAKLADKLGLGLDSFVFLDDDPLQCAEVRRRFPEVLALPLPREGVAEFCRHLWPLDPRPGTTEGARRTGAYREHVAREDLRAASQSFQQFLHSLELHVAIAPLGEGDLARGSELTHRTNQFNLTGLRMNEAELHNFMLQDSSICAGVRVRDRFGDYGLVGLILAEPSGRELRVPLLLLSCRALGRGVEHQMVAYLGGLARERGAERVTLHCVPSKRNDPAREFMHQLGETQTREDGTLDLTLEPATAEAVSLDLNAAPRRAEAPSGSTDRGAVKEDIDPVARRVEFLATLPLSLARTETIVAAVHGLDSRVSKEREGDGDPVETLLMQTFGEQLGTTEIPRDAGFFELGGESLQAMQILSRVSGEFGIELDTTLLFTTNFTVEELTEEINSLRNPEGPDVAPEPPTLRTAPDR